MPIETPKYVQNDKRQIIRLFSSSPIIYVVFFILHLYELAGQLHVSLSEEDKLRKRIKITSDIQKVTKCRAID